MYKLYLEENTSSNALLAKALLDYNITNYEIIYSKNGKPYLKDIPLFFNISHDNDMVALVISDKEVGIDLEYLTYRPNVVKRFFAKNEQLIMKKSSNKEYDFTRIWVMKEAFVKMKGIGILYGLDKIDTTKLEKQIDIINKDKYIIAICKCY